MNKKIKKLICITLAISSFSAILPASNFNLMLEKAYAYSSSDDVAFLEDIDLNHGSLSFSKTKTSYSVKVSNSIEEIELTATPENINYEVTIDGETQSGEWTKILDLNRGKNNFRVRVSDPSGDNGPITYNIHITRGDSEDDDEEIYLDNITLSDGEISFSRIKTSYNVNVADSVDEIRIKAEPEEDDATVKINGTEVDEDDKYRKTVSLSKGKNEIVIKIQEDEDSDDEDSKIYTLNIYRGGSAVTNVIGEIDDDQDDIFLDDIVLEDGDVPLNFKPKVTSYAVDVKEDWEDIIIKAEPKNAGDVSRINGDRLDEDGKYRKKVALKKGKNIIEIKVSNEDEYDSEDDEDEYEERVYTLTIYRGTSEGSAVSKNNSNSGIANKDVKINQWINSNGKWQYNDATGTPLKNTWFFDKSSGKNYYLQADGSMATGWISNNGSWYYLDESGAMQTGWKQVGYSWYYLDAQGKMKTGWFKDSDGKYYYLYPSGAMAYNTTIGGFKLSSNGAWTK